jgi:hypothetical protein
MMAKWFEGAAQSIGGTPLICLDRFTEGAIVVIPPEPEERHLSSIRLDGAFALREIAT